MEREKKIRDDKVKREKDEREKKEREEREKSEREAERKKNDKKVVIPLEPVVKPLVELSLSNSDRDRAVTNILEVLKGAPPGEVLFSVIQYWTENFEMKNRIGGGGFGDVFKGYIKSSTPKCNLFIAVKKLDTARLLLAGGDIEKAKKDAKNSLIREVKVLSTFKHKHIIKLLGYSLPPDSRGEELCLIYELASKGSIEHILMNDETAVEFSWDKRVPVLVQLADVLNYLHSRKCFHRDLKSDNAGLDKDYFVKVLDWGLSKYIPNEKEDGLGILSFLHYYYN